MKITTEIFNDKIAVFLNGEIDIPGAEKMKKCLSGILIKDYKQVKLDFAKVTFIGSSGIGKLLVFYKDFTKKGNKLEMVNLNKNVKSLFVSLKLDKMFNI